jgi:manganese transport protein
MGVFANAVWVQALSWTAAAVILSLNGWLAWETLAPLGWWAWAIAAPVLFLLLRVLASPWLAPAKTLDAGVRAMPEASVPLAEAPSYQRILIPLDHSPLDAVALGHAASLARQHRAKLLLLHVEEGVTSHVYGASSETGEVEAGDAYLLRLTAELAAQGISAEYRIEHGKTPRAAIIAAARNAEADLIIMGAHGHSGLADLIFGSTINAVRHGVNIPVLIVREPRLR